MAEASSASFAGLRCVSREYWKAICKALAADDYDHRKSVELVLRPLSGQQVNRPEFVAIVLCQLNTGRSPYSAGSFYCAKVGVLAGSGSSFQQCRFHRLDCIELWGSCCSTEFPTELASLCNDFESDSQTTQGLDEHRQMGSILSLQITQTRTLHS
jgi:hypothetical protein